MTYFLGLDVALANSGLCLLNKDSEIIISEVLKTKKDDIIEERIKQICEFVHNIILGYSIQSIYLEGLSYGSTGQSFSEMCGVHYCLRCMIYEDFDLNKLSIITPSQLKKFITGKGNCKKDLILLNVYKKFGIEFENSDLADSYVLAKMSLSDYLEKD